MTIELFWALVATVCLTLLPVVAAYFIRCVTDHSVESVSFFRDMVKVVVFFWLFVAAIAVGVFVIQAVGVGNV